MAGTNWIAALLPEDGGPICASAGPAPDPSARAARHGQPNRRIFRMTPSIPFHAAADPARAAREPHDLFKIAVSLDSCFLSMPLWHGRAGSPFDWDPMQTNVQSARESPHGSENIFWRPRGDPDGSGP